MRTKASIKGHAIHQMLIPFPFALFTGVAVFELLALITSNNSFHQTSFYLLIFGILSAMASAIPGIIDYLYSVPPNSTGKSRATKHMIVNLSSTTLFIIALIIRFDNPDLTIFSAIVLEFIAVVLINIGGWMGGTLVNRNFIGPDHRYANKGKWKEISFNEDKDEYEVADEKELLVNQMKLVRINNKRIVLSKTEEGYAAFDDSCTHRGGSLAGGVMICGTVQCLWHGSQFDVKSGAVKAGPAVNGIFVYDVVVKNGKVFLHPKKITNNIK